MAADPHHGRWGDPVTYLIILESVACAGIWLCVAWPHAVDNTRIGRQLYFWYWSRGKR
jgi:hypothetical protein